MPALGLALSLPHCRYGGAAGNSAEVQQFFDRLLTPPTSAREALYAALIDGLVADGVWAKLDVLNVCCAFDEATALANLVQTSYLSSREQSAGAATFTADQGWSAGSVLRRVTTNFNPSTASSPNFTRNDGMVALWIYSTATVTQNAMGIGNAGTDIGTVELYPKYNSTDAYFALNNPPDTTATAGADSSGFFIVQRTASNASAMYRNDGLIGSASVASTAVSNAKIFVRCEHSTRAYAVGASLTAGQRTALYTRLSTFITAVTGGVP